MLLVRILATWRFATQATRWVTLARSSGSASTELDALVVLERGDVHHWFFYTLRNTLSVKVLEDSNTLKGGNILVAMINETWYTAIGVEL